MIFASFSHFYQKLIEPNVGNQRKETKGEEGESRERKKEKSKRKKKEERKKAKKSQKRRKKEKPKKESIIEQEENPPENEPQSSEGKFGNIFCNNNKFTSPKSGRDDTQSGRPSKRKRGKTDTGGEQSRRQRRARDSENRIR